MRSFFRLLGVFLERHPVWILAGAVLVTAAAVLGVRNIEWGTGQDTMVSSSSTVFQDTERYQREFGADAVLILLTADVSTIFSTENLAALQALEQDLSGTDGVKIVVGPAALLGATDTLDDRSGTANPGDSEPAASGGDAPGSSLLFTPDGEIDPRLSRVVPDDRHALIAVRLEGDLNSEEDVLAAVETAVEGHPLNGVDVLVSGTPMIEPAIRSDMNQDMQLMLALAVILMVLVLFVVFRARWRLLSLPLVLLAVLWSFGVMGFASLPLSMVTMSGLPILIGLGVDYAIQFHNRYEEEIGRGDSPAMAVIDAMTHIGPAVGIAVLATALGFSVLLVSAVPMIRDFGVQITVGVIVLYLAGLLLLNAVLYQRDRRSDISTMQRAAASGSDRAERFLAGLARQVISLPIPIVLVAVAASGVGFYLDQHLTVQTDFEKLMPQDNPVLADLRSIREVLGGTREVGILIEGADLGRPEVLDWALDYENRERAVFPDGIVASTSLASLLASENGGSLPPPAEVARAIEDLPSPVRGSVLSADGTKASVSFTTKPMPVAELHDMIQSMKNDLDPPPGVSAAPAGRFVIVAQGMVSLTENRELMTLLALAAIGGGLLIVYRNLTRSLMPVIPILLVVGWSSAVMYVAGIELNPLTAVLGALIIGIGTEFTILLMERYYEEKAKGLPPREAMVLAVSRVGRAITASGLTVMAGFSALLFSDFAMLQDFGKVTVIDVFLSLVSTLVVLPPIIVWVDELRGSGVT